LAEAGERQAGLTERGEVWGELGNSAQLWPTAATTTGTMRIQREETEGKYGLGVG